MKEGTIFAVGSRKTATAKVWLSEGEGKIRINNRDLKEYIRREDLIHKILMPFRITGTTGKYDVKVKVSGGGISGQTDAISLGISKALVEIDESFKATLKNAGLLTRDPREKERMKYGKAKRRKSFQFSKR